jgi:hypothetical protein
MMADQLSVDIDIDPAMEAAADAWLAECHLAKSGTWRGRSEPAPFVVRAFGLKQDVLALLALPALPVWVKSVGTATIQLAAAEYACDHHCLDKQQSCTRHAPHEH